MNRSRNQWITLSAVLFLALMARLSVAATHGGSTSDSWQSHSDFPINLAVGPDMLVIPGGTGFGFNIDATTPVTHRIPFFVGLETGMDFNAGYGSAVNPATVIINNNGTISINGTGATYFHILATGVYRLDVKGWKTVHPFTGIALGPAIPLGSPGSAVQMEAELRLGVAIDLTRAIALNLAPNIGTFGSSFMFKPTAQMAFAF